LHTSLYPKTPIITEKRLKNLQAAWIIITTISIAFFILITPMRFTALNQEVHGLHQYLTQIILPERY